MLTVYHTLTINCLTDIIKNENTIINEDIDKMPIVISEKFKKLINASAVKNSVVPVFICDESLTVCAKSVGAERYFPRPTVRNSILPYIDESKIKLLDDGTDHITSSFSRVNEVSYCVITKGTIEEFKYYALIIEPMIQFCPPAEPWYIKESCGTLVTVLKDLVAGQKTTVHDLSTAITRFSRLCSFTDTKMGLRYVNASLIDILDSVVVSAAPILNSIHSTLTLASLPGQTLDVHTSPINVYVALSTMIASIISLSDDGRISVDCKLVPDSSTAEISVSTAPNVRLTKKVLEYSQLISADNPFALELAALVDIAEANGFGLDVKHTDNRISLILRLETEAKPTSVFHSPEIPGADLKFFMEFLSELVGLLPRAQNN